MGGGYDGLRGPALAKNAALYSGTTAAVVVQFEFSGRVFSIAALFHQGPELPRVFFLSTPKNDLLAGVYSA
jgi:hypothetical protein